MALASLLDIFIRFSLRFIIVTMAERNGCVIRITMVIQTGFFERIREYGVFNRDKGKRVSC